MNDDALKETIRKTEKTQRIMKVTNEILALKAEVGTRSLTADEKTKIAHKIAGLEKELASLRNQN